jgi:hypothetical protein
LLECPTDWYALSLRYCGVTPGNKLSPTRAEGVRGTFRSWTAAPVAGCGLDLQQIEGLTDHYDATAAPQLDPMQRIEAADLFVANTGADIRHGGLNAGCDSPNFARTSGQRSASTGCSR